MSSIEHHYYFKKFHVHSSFYHTILTKCLKNTLIWKQLLPSENAKIVQVMNKDDMNMQEV